VTTDRYPLPEQPEVGCDGRWRLPTNDEGGEVELTGTLLGVGASRRYRHKHDGDVVPTDGRCSACRWFEVRIFRTEDDRYLLHFAGRSVVPGEVTRYRTEWTSSGFDVLEALTTRREGGRDVYLTAPAARALAQGAEYDDGLREAYVERAVS
jgi:hypothetical protein